jgi:hypothetical protein
MGNQLEQIARGLRGETDVCRPMDLVTVSAELAYLREELHHALKNFSARNVG